MMFSSKRFTALLTAIVSAAALAAVPASNVSAEDAGSEDAAFTEEMFPADGEEEPEFVDPVYAGICTQFGDVNSDRIVGIADAVQLQRFLLGQIETLGNWKNADLNENGEIDVVDFTMLKQQITGHKRQGASLAVGVVDMMTGESVAGVTVHLWVLYGEHGYDLGEWLSEPNQVMYFSGLPTDDKYEYIIDATNLPEDYLCGELSRNWYSQMRFSLNGKTDAAVNVRLIRKDEECNIKVNMYDWAMDKESANGVILPYANLRVETKDGVPVYGITPWNTFALPDGEYHLDALMHPCPEVLIDPESDFAKYVKENHPEVEFTDQRNGIDFTVKDGKPDRDLTFDLGPHAGTSNSITVTCKDGTTGEPVEGVKLALIEAPEKYARKVAEWTSDSTGTHVFDGLVHTGYDLDNHAYRICVEEVPEGWRGGFDQNVSFGYVCGENQEVNYVFAEDMYPETVSANVINFEDKSQFNDVATYEIWRLDPNDDAKADKVYAAVHPGTKVYLADGKYFAALHNREAGEKGYISVTFLTRRGQQLKKFFKAEDYMADAGIMEFNVQGGKQDKELTFYVKKIDPLEDEEYYTPEELAKYEALWGEGTD